MVERYRLSTSDNPFDPFTQFDEWYAWDITHGYDCSGYLARMANTSESFDEDLNQAFTNMAIDEIVALNDTRVEGVNFIKVAESGDESFANLRRAKSTVRH